MAQTAGLGSVPGSDWGCITRCGHQIVATWSPRNFTRYTPESTPFVHVFPKRCAWQSGTMMASTAPGSVDIWKGHPALGHQFDRRYFFRNNGSVIQVARREWGTQTADRIDEVRCDGNTASSRKIIYGSTYWDDSSPCLMWIANFNWIECILPLLLCQDCR